MNPSDTPESELAHWKEIAMKAKTLSHLEILIMDPRCPTALYSCIYDRAAILAGEEAINSGIGIDWRYEIRKFLAAHPNCPIDILRNLSDYSEIEIRALVASNPNTELEVLAKLSKARSVQIKRGLMKNPELPEGIKNKVKI